MLLMCALFYVLLGSPLFPGRDGLLGIDRAWTTPLSGHFISTLAFLPVLHILSVLCGRPSTNVLQILCLALQAAGLYMVFRLRISAAWILIPVFLAGIVSLMRPLFETKTDTTSCSLLIHLSPIGPGRDFAVQMRRCWPVLTIIGAIVMAHLAYSSQLHPLYRTGNNLTRHALCFEFKLTGMWHVIIASTKWVIGTASVLTLVLLSFFIAFAAFLVAIASMQERRAFRVLLMFIAFCVPASWLPNLVGFVGWEVAADGIFAWLFFLFGFLAYVLGVVLQYLVVPIFRKSAAADRVAPLTQ
jgi:hypothetical protein